MTAINPVLAFVLAGGAAAYFLRRQFDFDIFGVVFFGTIVGLMGIEASRMYPPYQEFFQVRQILATMAKQSDFSSMSATDVRAAFDAKAERAKVVSIAGKDLDITRGSGNPAVTATYQVVVPVYGNLQFVLDFDYSPQSPKALAADS